jgi:hypothetical protein
MRGRGPLMVALAAVLALTGCVGSITRQDLDHEMRARGSGGMGQRLALSAVEAVREELGTDDVQLRSLTLSPGRAVLEVRVDGPTDALDAYHYGTSGLYGGGGLDGPTPLQVNPEAPPLDDQVFWARDAGLDRLNDMVDEARGAADLARGYVDRVTINRPNDVADPVISIIVTDQRATATVAFGPDGSVLEVAAQ